MPFLQRLLGLPGSLLHAQNSSLGKRQAGNWTRCPSHLNPPPSVQRSSGSIWISYRVTELLTLFFRSLPKAYNHKWGYECRSMGTSRAFPFGSRKVQQPRHCRRRTNPTVNVTLHSPLAYLFTDLEWSSHPQTCSVLFYNDFFKKHDNMLYPFEILLHIFAIVVICFKIIMNL